MLKLVSVICSLTDPNMSMSTYVNQALVNKQIINHKSLPIFWDGNPPSRRKTSDATGASKLQFQ